MENRREIRFPEVLSRLIDAGYKRERQKICEAVGVSGSALSALARGRSKPSLDTLAKLADFLGVTIDFLVYGTQTESPPSGYHEAVMNEMRAIFSKELDAVYGRYDLAVRLTQALDDRIQDAVARLKEEGKVDIPAGLWFEDETMRLERHSHQCMIVTLDLGNDMKITEDRAVPWGFFETVVQNLRKGVSYRYLIPKTNGVSEDIAYRVIQYRELLKRSCADNPLALSNIELRYTKTPVLGAFSLYEINIAEIQHREPYMCQRIWREGFETHPWIGFVSPTSPNMRVDLMMDGLAVERAVTIFNRLWYGATKA